MRYKMAKGDPSGFKVYLKRNGLPLSLIPRYRGNRLHILFLTSGIIIAYHNHLIEFLSSGTDCGGLRLKLKENLAHPIIHSQLQVIGLLGKFDHGAMDETLLQRCQVPAYEEVKLSSILYR
jgi:hypothetical protein